MNSHPGGYEPARTSHPLASVPHAFADASQPFVQRYRSTDGRDSCPGRSPFDTSGRTVSHSIVDNDACRESRT